VLRKGKIYSYIMHNCVQSICDTLPIEAEALVVEMYEYKYFHMYTMLERFCDEVDTAYSILLKIREFEHLRYNES
jgi:hypothetical protein